MPGLLIHLVDNTNWTASIANTNVSYKFLGDNLRAQEIKMHQFATEMQTPDDFDIANCFVNEQNFTSEEIAEQIFNTTDTLIFNGEVIYTAVDELSEDLAMAGRVLLETLIELAPV